MHASITQYIDTSGYWYPFTRQKCSKSLGICIAASIQRSSIPIPSLRRLPVHSTRARLVARENQSVRNNDILPPTSDENHNLGNILRRERLNTSTNSSQQHISPPPRARINSRINRIGLRLITIEPHHRELGLHLAGVNLHDSDTRRNQLLAETVRKAADRSLGSAVDRAASVGLPPRDRADVDDVSLSAARVEDLNDLLCQLHRGCQRA
jgi:hypothetical protein